MYAMLDGGGGSGLLPSLSDLPDVDTDAALLLDSAESLASAGSQLRERSETAAGTWGDLPAVYTAAGTEPLYSEFQPILNRGDAVATALTTAADALSEFALAVGGFRFEHEGLSSRITSLRSRYFETEPDSVDRMMLQTEIETLRGDVSAFAARVELAEQACVDALSGIRGGTTFGVTASTVTAAGGGSYLDVLDAAVADSAVDQLEQLAQMTPEEAEAWLAANPTFVDVLTTSPPPPEEVNAWWVSLSQRPDASTFTSMLITTIPHGLGNLNGVPYWARSEANIIVLDEAISQAYDDIANAEPGVTPNIPSQEQSDATERLMVLLAIADSMGGRFSYDLTGHQLVELHLDGEQPFAAISSGNLDAADYVSVMAPGMNSTVESALPGMVANGDSLLAAQQDALASRGEDSQAAVLSWVGYTAPGFDTVFGNQHALDGAPAFGETLAGLDGTLTQNGPDGDGPYTSVLMHSYGGTMGSWALHQGDYDIDNAVFLNSPGVIVDSAGEVNADQVWAATPPDDYVVDVGNLQDAHPHLPRDPDFGAYWYDIPDTPGGIVGAHGLEHHFIDDAGDPYGPDSTAPGGALAPLVDITLGEGDQGSNVEPVDGEQWWLDHLQAGQEQPPW